MYEELFADRETSLLEFHSRVLKQAERSSVPLLERLKFMSVFYSNIDEFFMVRVGKQCKKGYARLKYIYDKAREISENEKEIFEGIKNALRAENIEFTDPDSLSENEEELISKYFRRNIMPVVSPIVIDVNHPFPFLRNNEIYVCCELKTKRGNLKFGIITFSGLSPHFIYEYDGKYKICITSELVRHFSQQIFTRHSVSESVLVRVTRNADIEFDDFVLEGYDADFRSIMTDALKKRKRLQAVRLVMSDTPSDIMEAFLIKKLKIDKGQIFVRKTPLDFSFAYSLAANLGAEKKHLLYNKYVPVKSPLIRKGHIMEYIDKSDILLSFPYQSIQTFIELLYEAGNDPDVISIKITLYRMANHSRIVSALAYAAEQGKEVICVLELRARFDEENNINYAGILEDSGCTVIYGPEEYKLHAKVCHITRRSKTGEISYITQIGTGNYNEKTSEQYTDLSLITADEEIGLDAAELFRTLCEGELCESSRSLWIGPKLYISHLSEEIEKERLKGEKGRIRIKANALNNTEVMGQLINASAAGVRTELFIRGICCLKPGIPKLTENITVKSALGKYLEHSRIFCFGDGDSARIYIGSGDLLNRNLLKRVEVLAPINSPSIKSEILHMLGIYEKDTVMSHRMLPDGSYSKEPYGKNETDAQIYFENYFTGKQK